MATPSKKLDLCVDACVLVNFAIVSRVDVLARISDLSCHVPREVLDEILYPEQKAQVESAIASGGLKAVRVETVEELEAFTRYTIRFGKGESACLAIAAGRRWVMATDETKDKRFSREIESSGVQVINTPGLLLKAIRQDVLTVEEADAVKAELEKSRFKMSFNSFRDLMGGASSTGSN